MITLEAARDYLDQNLDEGISCPCCGQHAQKYRYKLNKTMALGLIGLVKAYSATGAHVHVHDIPVGNVTAASTGGTFAKLAHWGLIEAKVNDDTKKRCSGLWKPTKAGIAFAWNQGKAASFVSMFNATVTGFSDDMVTIKQALGREFDYAELMGGE